MSTTENTLPAKEVKVDFKQFNKLSKEMRKYMIKTLAQSFDVKENQLVSGGVNLVQHSNALDATTGESSANKTKVGNQKALFKPTSHKGTNFESGSF